MLTYRQALQLLYTYCQPGQAWLNHSLKVAEVGVTIARELKRRHPIRVERARILSLIHDIGRYKTHHPVFHGYEGYKLLLSLGYYDAARICMSHVCAGITADEAIQFGLPHKDFLPLTLEEKVVAVADLITDGDQITTVDQRFESIKARYNRDDSLMSFLSAARPKALNLLAEMEGLIGVPISIVLR